jgi:hypothetical protein
MPQPILGPAGVTYLTPPAVETYTKVIKLDTSAGDATGFQACVLPKGAIVIGAYVIAGGANTTQTISVGITNGGAEFISAYAPNSTGYDTVGAAAGTYIKALTAMTADTPVYAKASAALTSACIVKLEYYFPQSGMTW